MVLIIIWSNKILNIVINWKKFPRDRWSTLLNILGYDFVLFNICFLLTLTIGFLISNLLSENYWSLSLRHLQITAKLIICDSLNDVVALGGEGIKDFVTTVQGVFTKKRDNGMTSFMDDPLVFSALRKREWSVNEIDIW